MADGLAGRDGATRPVLPGLASGQPRQLLLAPDARLLQRCEPAGVLDAGAIVGIVADLIATLRLARGRGIAAPQIGAMNRIFVIEGDPPVICIDPEILWRSERTESRIETCLSRPDRSCHVDRPVEIRLGCYDLDGRYHDALLDGPDARIAQHLADHLDGRMIPES
ncbi:peptide deformylase [Paracoccus sp. PARArs4]|uniref:peptide deformylase n=1 Tax=Paracoccus sp. PARArs4 TaxID=2853442 RepID=UPI0024A73A92|nr:peptide deformylase [Paracoccus sp. PARArs4]